jgi:hypothetical protein
VKTGIRSNCLGIKSGDGHSGYFLTNWNTWWRKTPSPRVPSGTPLWPLAAAFNYAPCLHVTMSSRLFNFGWRCSFVCFISLLWT